MHIHNLPHRPHSCPHPFTSTSTFQKTHLARQDTNIETTPAPTNTILITQSIQEDGEVNVPNITTTNTAGLDIPKSPHYNPSSSLYILYISLTAVLLITSTQKHDCFAAIKFGIAYIFIYIFTFPTSPPSTTTDT